MCLSFVGLCSLVDLWVETRCDCCNLNDGDDGQSSPFRFGPKSVTVTGHGHVVLVLQAAGRKERKIVSKLCERVLFWWQQDVLVRVLVDLERLRLALWLTVREFLRRYATLTVVRSRCR